MSTTSTQAGERQRRFPAPGLYNLRDTGGYQAGGQTSRWGKLFRSDGLHNLDDQGRQILGDLEIRHIVDLRGTAEVAASPSQVDGLTVQIHHLPVFDDADPSTQVASHTGLESVYDHIVDERGPQLVSAIRVIVETGLEPVLVHCTAGKDRTGIVIAFALTAAGVARDEVTEDFAQSAENLRGEWAEAMLQGVRDQGGEITDAVRELITTSPAAVMAALLDRVEAERGSVAAYLTSNGLTDEELAQLRELLLD